MKGKNLEGLREALPHRSMSTQWSRLRTTKDLDILRDIFKNALGVLSEDLDGGGIPLLFVSSGEHWFLACLTQRNPRWLLCVRGSAGQGQEGGRGGGAEGGGGLGKPNCNSCMLLPCGHIQEKGAKDKISKVLGGSFPRAISRGGPGWRLSVQSPPCPGWLATPAHLLQTQQLRQADRGLERGLGAEGFGAGASGPSVGTFPGPSGGGGVPRLTVRLET